MGKGHNNTRHDRLPLARHAPDMRQARHERLQGIPRLHLVERQEVVQKPLSIHWAHGKRSRALLHRGRRRQALLPRPLQGAHVPVHVPSVYPSRLLQKTRVRLKHEKKSGSNKRAAQEVASRYGDEMLWLSLNCTVLKKATSYSVFKRKLACNFQHISKNTDRIQTTIQLHITNQTTTKCWKQLLLCSITWWR